MHLRLIAPWCCWALLGLVAVGAGCGGAVGTGASEARPSYSAHGQFEDEPVDASPGQSRQALVTCSESPATGYRNGSPYPITVVTADGKPATVPTANAYAVMQDSAARGGIFLRVISGFRSYAEQSYLYACHQSCACNGCALAAPPGYSNHETGLALDLNTRDPGVLNWLYANAGRFGFQRTVPSEDWHWEHLGAEPAGGPCGAQPVGVDGCTAQEDHNAAAFACACVDHRANGGYCPGTGCSAQETRNAATFGCGCVDHQGNGGYCPGTGCTIRETQDAAKFGCSCVDHQANGGFCPGSGCTERETLDAQKFGCGCVDHHASGGFCPGSGCTVGETRACSAQGKGCALHVCK